MHPLKKNIPALFIGLLLVLLWTLLHLFLVVYYLEYSWRRGLGESLISTSLLAVIYYYSGFFIGFIRVWQAQFLFSLLIPLICQFSIGLFLWGTGTTGPDLFFYTLPIRFLLNLLTWIVVMQWYVGQTVEVEETELGETKECMVSETEEEILKRITVKEGSKVHILPVEEVVYIQAGGDYVNFFTANGQYVKELTMKYLETHLPDSFVRIHRSTIVNTGYIHRMELFAKDTWQIRLQNGTTLRASLTGYRLLKERLGL